MKTVFLIVAVAVAALSPGRAIAGGLLWEKELDSRGGVQAVHGGGRDGKGWVGDDRSPGTSLRGTARSSMGQMGSPVTRSKA